MGESKRLQNVILRLFERFQSVIERRPRLRVLATCLGYRPRLEDRASGTIYPFPTNSPQPLCNPNLFNIHKLPNALRP